MKKDDNLWYERLEQNNCVLWDGKTGAPFFCPPGREITNYLAKGFRVTPPKGWVQEPERPIVPPKSDPQGRKGFDWVPSAVAEAEAKAAAAKPAKAAKDD